MENSHHVPLNHSHPVTSLSTAPSPPLAPQSPPEPIPYTIEPPLTPDVSETTATRSAPPSPEARSKGRKKILIEYIADNRSRQVTFLKRKNGILKKAHELSVLCGANVAVVIFNNDNGKLYEYFNPAAEDTFARYAQYTGVSERRRSDVTTLAAAKGSVDMRADEPRAAAAAAAAAGMAALRHAHPEHYVLPPPGRRQIHPNVTVPALHLPAPPPPPPPPSLHAQHPGLAVSHGHAAARAPHAGGGAPYALGGACGPGAPGARELGAAQGSEGGGPVGPGPPPGRADPPGRYREPAAHLTPLYSSARGASGGGAFRASLAGEAGEAGGGGGGGAGYGARAEAPGARARDAPGLWDAARAPGAPGGAWGGSLLLRAPPDDAGRFDTHQALLPPLPPLLAYVPGPPRAHGPAAPHPPPAPPDPGCALPPPHLRPRALPWEDGPSIKRAKGE